MISQSLIKAYNDYLNGNLCGILFEKQYITKEIESEPTESMKLGIYFEYLCTGQFPKSGKIEGPKTLKTGEFSAEYKRVVKQADNFKEYINKLCIKIKKAGVYIEKGISNGIIDIEAEFEGNDIIIDLKYSGLLDNKWEELGWNTEALPYKEKIMIQAVHYTYLTEKPFYFWVFSSANEDCKLIKVNIDPEAIKNHIQLIEKTKDMIDIDKEMGFNAHPELNRCKKCPLFTSCEHKTEVPIIETVYYTN